MPGAFARRRLWNPFLYAQQSGLHRACVEEPRFAAPRSGDGSSPRVNIQHPKPKVEQTTLTPSLSHPMGEGETVDALVENDRKVQSKALAPVPSPVGRERVRVRVFWAHFPARTAIIFFRNSPFTASTDRLPSTIVKP